MIFFLGALRVNVYDFFTKCLELLLNLSESATLKCSKDFIEDLI